MGTTRLQLMDRDTRNNALSFSENGPRNLWPSVSNYVLKVSSSNESESSPVAYLYFLDSGGGSYPEVISNAQTIWFNSTSQEINPDSRYIKFYVLMILVIIYVLASNSDDDRHVTLSYRVPEIIFWHIPSRAYETVAPSGVINKPCVGSINNESVAPQDAELGIMKALEARPSVQVCTIYQLQSIL